MQVFLPPGARAAQTRLDVNGRDVTREFAVLSGGEVRRSGDRPGQRAQRADRSASRRLRSAPDDHQPPDQRPDHQRPAARAVGLRVRARPTRPVTSRPRTATYYKSTDSTKTGLQPYDPANPPTDVATTTTQTGTTVPFIVRVETGYEDRDQYQIAALFQPRKPWSALAPQPQFNHKLLITHGVSCGVDYQTGTAPSVTSYNPSPVSSPIVPTADSGQYALGAGFAVMSTALDYSGHNCNLPLQAESLIMAKEHLIDTYGTLRYTIGTGCSGGSLAQQWIANAYPGIYQGILPTCSFPDAWGTATQFLDYHLMLAYFNDPSKWATGVVWSPTQMADAEGHISIVNSEVSDNAQWHVAVPTDNCAGVTDAQRYNAQTNPGGVRCDIQDAAINVFGPDPRADWSASEKKAGHGFAVPPIDNVGVEYGLGALQQGKITPAQFVDLNEKIGGVDIDTNPTASRIATRGAALANAYRSGMINETNNLDQTAIIDCRGPDPGAFHDAYRAFALRARLDREHGNHANQLIWEGPALIIGDTQCNLTSLIAMDRWLGAVEKDTSSKTQAQKIADDKPSDLGDECYDGNGNKVSDGLCPPGVVPIYGTPRTVAGDAITTDANKCQLKPLSRSGNYGPIPFTDAQWAQLQSLFPNGVCDFSKPGVDQQPTIPWMTYQDARGHVIYGGRPLGPAAGVGPVRSQRRLHPRPGLHRRLVSRPGQAGHDPRSDPSLVPELLHPPPPLHGLLLPDRPRDPRRLPLTRSAADALASAAGARARPRDTRPDRQPQLRPEGRAPRGQAGRRRATAEGRTTVPDRPELLVPRPRRTEPRRAQGPSRPNRGDRTRRQAADHQPRRLQALPGQILLTADRRG